jgi:hypothetical protein
MLDGIRFTTGLLRNDFRVLEIPGQTNQGGYPMRFEMHPRTDVEAEAVTYDDGEMIERVLRDEREEAIVQAVEE